jgi:hypothetical protein
MRASLPSMTVQIPSIGKTLQGTPYPMDRAEYELELSGIRDVIVGGVRLICSEIGPQMPREGVAIFVTDRNKDVQEYRITRTREDNFSGSADGAASILIIYGLEES